MKKVPRDYGLGRSAFFVALLRGANNIFRGFLLQRPTPGHVDNFVGNMLRLRPPGMLALQVHFLMPVPSYKNVMKSMLYFDTWCDQAEWSESCTPGAGLWKILEANTPLGLDGSYV